MRLGQYEEGWHEYRWRTERQHDDFKVPVGPIWRGEETDGPVVVYTEQGFGDAVQFARFLPAVEKRVGSLLVSCQPKLMGLFDRMAGNHGVCPRDDELDPDIPKASIMDLPDILTIDSTGIEIEHPYLTAKEATPKKFHFLRDLPHPRVGIVWAGNPFPDPLRTCPLDYFIDLSRSQGIQLQSLLVGPESAEITDDVLTNINDLSSLQDNFDDTASAIKELNLVISVDTAIAHLSAAMGKETWLLLPYRADWRWPLEGSTTPWYASMRLFRQSAFSDWAGVFSEVDAQLTEWRN